MERRALIAVVVSLVILIAYQELAVRWLAPRQLPGAPEEVEPPPAPSPAEHEEVAEPEPQAVPAPAAEGEKVDVETDLYRAVFTSVGARLESLQLKRYRTTVAPDSPAQETVVPGQHGQTPFGVELRGTKALSDTGASFAVEGGPLRLTGKENGSIDFVWRTGGATVRKRFTFYGDRYDFDVIVTVEGVSPDQNELGITWVRGEEPIPPPGTEVAFDRAVFLDGKKVTEEQFKKLADGQVHAGDIVWAGYAGRHFLGSMIPVEAPSRRLWLKLRDQTVEEKLLFPVKDAARIKLDVYVGPKDIDVLHGVGHDLTRAVDLGWFGFIALPLLHILKFSHRFTGNYGVDILLLTVVIKILFIPLTQRSFQSMREMQKLQPQMAKIRERFKDNSEQMNKEIMELYRRHKVNPLGGCLPMVLQIPVFIGLYSALMHSVELRHAPFVLWINDLAAPDRLGTLVIPFVHPPGIPVLTALMGVSMFVQQWMTPTAGDPTQQRMMMIMPAVFTVMFLNVPSGLVLYWLVNNILTIAQQYYMARAST
jgi:YidC/Oxa1 family membrane protein insertase